MKAYGYNVVRNGTRTHKFGCCNLRNGCCDRGNCKKAEMAFKRRARAAGKADIKAQAADN